MVGETRSLLPRGVRVCRRRRSSDSGRPPPPPSQPEGQWHVARERLPSQRRDRSGLAPDSLAARRFGVGDEHRVAMARSRVLPVWLPIVLWAAVIFTFSSIPSLSTGLGTWDTI